MSQLVSAALTLARLHCALFRLRVGYNFAFTHWFLLGFATLLQKKIPDEDFFYNFVRDKNFMKRVNYSVAVRTTRKPT
jgi:hypothetical protein